ncbi:MAG: hypothetical protein B6229_09540 [Spirochaetaceae bacterium 4572_7]|nr:MAG: hypothetical protein B6229_09540 [Spirochaetaceae bacterium 4572_7]
MAAATGLRIGWTISSPEITKPMVIANQYISTCASSVSQYAAIKALDGSSCQFLKDIRANLQFKRDYAYSFLTDIPHISVEKPKGANISWFGFSKDVAHKILKDCDVLTIPGIAFGDRGDNHIRISYAVDFDNLKEALFRIKNVLSNWRK